MRRSKTLLLKLPNKPIHSLLSSEFSKDNFSENIRHILIKFTQITEVVCSVDIQRVCFKSLIREYKACANEAKNVNKDLPTKAALTRPHK